MRHPQDRIVVYYPDPRSRPQQDRQPPRPPARRKTGPPAWLWPGVPIAGAAFAVYQIMTGPSFRPRKAPAPPPAPAPPKVITRTVPAHAMPGWEAIGLALIIGFVVLGVVSLAVHAYRSRA